MLFIFESGVASAFWMIDMHFPLDFVWISAECTIADITSEVPAPSSGAPSSALPTYASPAPAAYNFEINAGEAESHRMAVGDEVRFWALPPEVGELCP